MPRAWIRRTSSRPIARAWRWPARAGFDPYGLVAVLQQLRTATPDNPVFTLSLSTHPAPQARLDQIELAMGNRLDGWTGKAAGGGTRSAWTCWPAPNQQRQAALAAVPRRRQPTARPAASFTGRGPQAKPAAKPATSTKKP
jgi:predicted Zn-dependent protease